MMEFGIRLSVLHLYNGRRSLYVAVTIGRRVFWLQRWDAERQPRGVYEPSGAMTWAAGTRWRVT